MRLITLPRFVVLAAVAGLATVAHSQQSNDAGPYPAGFPAVPAENSRAQPLGIPAGYTNRELDLLQRLEAIEQRLKNEDGKAKQPDLYDPWEGWEDVTDEKWTHQVGGRLLTETVMWMDGDGVPGSENYTEIRQVRLGLRGTGYGVLDYRIQLDFEPEATDTRADDDNNIVGDSVTTSTFGSVGMKDLYVGMHEIPFFGYVRIGHFKVSFSHDQLISRRDMTFMERYPMSDPNGFTPGREIGVQAYNNSADQRITWQYGAFFDSISESAKQRVDDNQGMVVSARGTWTPFYDEPSDGRYLVHLGLGGIYTHPQDGSGRFSQRAEMHEGPVMIDTGAIAADDYTVLGTEFLWHWGSVYINNELMWSHVNAAGGDDDFYSGYVEAGWFLTGEHRNYNRKQGHFVDMKPFESFWFTPGCHGLGAWEVATRWSFVDFTESPNASEYNSLNLALNWYWNSRARVQLNWLQPFTNGAPLGDTESSILSLRLAAYF
jgi:phosphate-selective porin OprO/OprP